jgi:hypothetical protein
MRCGRSWTAARSRLSRFQPGQRISLRELWDGRTWEVREGIVVRDEREVIAVYTPPRSPVTIAAGANGVRLRIPPPSWQLRQASIPDRHFLAVHPPGAGHTLIVIWDERWRLLEWYINLESDLCRTNGGFEYVDHFLDVVVAPDMTSWRWKDEDELEEAIADGLVTATEARSFPAEGERALAMLLRRAAPYDEAWERWRPSADWGT